LVNPVSVTTGGGFTAGLSLLQEEVMTKAKRNKYLNINFYGYEW
jgi:hypothetical protein